MEKEQSSSNIDMMMRKIYYACDVNRKDSVPVLTIIEYITPFMELHMESLTELKSILDPNNDNPKICSEVFYRVMRNWASKFIEIDGDSFTGSPNESFSPTFLSTPRASFGNRLPEEKLAEKLNLSAVSNESISNISQGPLDKTNLEEQNKELMHQYKKTCDELIHVRLQLATSEESNDVLQKELERLRRQLEHLREEKAVLCNDQKDTEEIQDMVSTTQKHIEKLKKSLATREKENNLLKVQNSTLESDRLRSEEKVANLHDKINEHLHSILTLQNQVDLKEKEITSHKKLTDYYILELDSHKQQVKDLQDSNETMQMELDNLRKHPRFSRPSSESLSEYNTSQLDDTKHKPFTAAIKTNRFKFYDFNAPYARSSFSLRSYQTQGALNMKSPLAIEPQTPSPPVMYVVPRSNSPKQRSSRFADNPPVDDISEIEIGNISSEEETSIHESLQSELMQIGVNEYEIKYNSLQEKYFELEREVNVHKSKDKNLNMDLMQLESEIKDLRKIIKTISDDLKCSHTQITELKATIQQLTQKNNDLEVMHRSESKLNYDLMEENNKMKHYNDKLEIKNTDTQEMLRDIKCKNEHLIICLEGERKLCRKKMKLWELEAEHNIAEAEENAKQLSFLEKELAFVNECKEGIQNEKCVLESTIENLMVKINELKESISEKNIELQGRIDECEMQCIKQLKEFNFKELNYLNLVNDLERKNSKEQEERKGVVVSFQLAKAMADGVINQLREKVEKYETENTECLKEIRALNVQLIELNTRIYHLEMSNSHFAKTVNELKRRNELVELRFKDATPQFAKCLTDFDKKLSELLKVITANKKDVNSSLLKENEDLKVKLEKGQKKGSFNLMKMKLDKLQEKYDDVNEKLESELSKAVHLEEKLNLFVPEFELLRNKLNRSSEYLVSQFGNEFFNEEINEDDKLKTFETSLEKEMHLLRKCVQKHITFLDRLAQVSLEDRLKHSVVSNNKRSVSQFSGLHMVPWKGVSFFTAGIIAGFIIIFFIMYVAVSRGHWGVKEAMNFAEALGPLVKFEWRGAPSM